MKIKVIIAVIVVLLLAADALYIIGKMINKPSAADRIESASAAYQAGNTNTAIQKLSYVVDTENMLDEQDIPNAALLLSKWYQENGDEANMYKYYDIAVAAKMSEIGGITLEMLPTAPSADKFGKNEHYKATKSIYPRISTLLSEAKAKDAVSLDVSSKKTQDLTGLSEFTNLKEINLSKNKTIDLNTLKGEQLPSLTALSLADCNLKDISALGDADLASLTYLDLSGNKITDLSPLAKITNLQVLVLNKNKLTAADISPLYELHSLRGLSLSATNYRKVEELAKLSGLIYLDISGNGLKGEQLQPIAAGLTYLTRLDAAKNKLTNLYEFAPSLQKLDITGNSVSDISTVSGTIGLTEFLANSNQITDVSALAGLKRLAIVNLSGNKIADLSPLDGLPNREEFVLPKARPAAETDNGGDSAEPSAEEVGTDGAA